ncbi:MAG: orotidine-5'-phosphate decarboxylase [Buchnera aphidicola (Periphyllus acericola)]|uniref:orotidine-5'-phosphate decarboxylase n=1 Tax=Buchnera aphidicola TaxID=9 RepID=UPI0030D0C609|nr:orotidine-5'-phosphate decarboxylase [Buchnera aphidicola (Periphyllus acericola)]
MLNNTFIKQIKTKIIIALDFKKINQAINLIKFLDPKIYRLKIGKEMFFLFGLSFIKKIINLGFKVFLDLKLHDIPNTVEKSIKSFSDLGIWMISIHAMGGKEMMKSAKMAISSYKKKPPLLVAVTVLSSLKNRNLKDIGIFISLKKYVLLLSKLCKKIGLDGVICPGNFSNNIKNFLGKDFKVISPGVRFLGTESHDQKNVIIPEDVSKLNIDYIVLGRIITLSRNPIQDLNLVKSKINNFI